MSSEAWTVPILPHTSPEAEPPEGLQLPLYPHQLRALNRCLVIEQDGSLGTDFGSRFDYKSRGGCLADAVGTGKTATSIGLVLEGEMGNGGDTLVVAPAHLIPQWKQEILKFASPNALEVVVGKEEYEQNCLVARPKGSKKRRIVLVDVDTILNESKLWYDWRQVYKSQTHAQKGLSLKVDKERMEVYKKAALYSVKSPRGPCSYTGWVYTSLLHLPKRPWRRVIFDEIQDLVAQGTESQKNLLQLSRTATHVWLLSATPFPHGNRSVYANHELLGFCRLRVDVNVDTGIFERIKRKLYIRSPPHVKDQALSAACTVTLHTIQVPQLDLERRFYQLEQERIRSSPELGGGACPFGFCYMTLREMTVHPEASEELRKQMLTTQYNNNNRNNKNRSSLASSSTVRPVSHSVEAAAAHAVAAAKRRLSQIEGYDLKVAQKQFQDTRRSLALADKVQTHRAGPLTSNPFAGSISTEKIQAAVDKEAKLIHDHYCTCAGGIGSLDCFADRHVRFRIIREEGSLAPEFLQGHGSLQKVISYFRQDLHPDATVVNGTGTTLALQRYKSVTLRTMEMRSKALENLEKEKRELKTRVETLSMTATVGGNSTVKNEDDLAARHGSKPAALVRFLQNVVQESNEKVIVFSYHHDTLKLIGRTLHKFKLPSVFCGGNGGEMSAALQAFTSGSTNIILLSAKSKASGANLQCATHVVLLDPAGSSPEHGSTLEEQAIGRAVRMGQERPVTVTRFCVLGTIEEQLFKEIDDAAAINKTRASNSKYVIQDANKTMPKKEKRMVTTAVEEEEESDDVQMTAAISGDERIRRQFQEAEETGNVIVLDDSADDKTDDDNASNSPTKNAPGLATTPSATTTADAVVVKQESVSTKKREQADCAKITQHSKRLRAQETTPSSTLARTVTQELSCDKANATVTPSVNTRDNGVRQLLLRLELTEYEAHFVAPPYNSLDWLYSVSGNTQVMEALATTVGFKPGHAIRFQSELLREAQEYGNLEDV